MLPQDLHSIRYFLCTSTNVTSHEMLFLFNRQPESGIVLPSWLMLEGQVFMKNNIRLSKFHPLVEEAVFLLECNSHYTLVRHNDGEKVNGFPSPIIQAGDSHIRVNDIFPDEN